MPSRRSLLQSSCIALAASAAGCLSGPSGSDGSATPATGTATPDDADGPALGASPYPAGWLPRPADGATPVAARFADVAGLAELDQWLDADVPLYFSPNQPLAEPPLGVDWALDFSAPGVSSGPNYGRVVRADVNVDEAASNLQDGYERETTREGFVLYGSDRRTVALEDGYLLVGPREPASVEEPVRTLVDVHAGAHRSALTDGVAAALSAAGDGLVVSAKTARRGFEAAPLGQVRTLVAAVDAEGDRATGRWVASFRGDESVPDDGTIEDWQGRLATAGPFPDGAFGHSVDGDLLTVTAEMGLSAYWQAVGN